MTTPRVPRGGGRFGGVIVSSSVLSEAQALFGQGRTLGEVQTFLTSQGRGIRRQALVDIRRETLAIRAAGNVFANIPANFRPVLAAIPISSKLFKRAFRYTLDVETIDNSIGQRRTVHVMFDDDEILTEEEAGERAIDIAESAINEYELEVESVTFGDLVRSGAS